MLWLIGVNSADTAAKISPPFSLKGKAACKFLCASVSRSSCRLLSHPPALLSDRHGGWGRDGSWWAEPALHHPAGQLRTFGIPRLHCAAEGQGVPGQRGSHQVTVWTNKTKKSCILFTAFCLWRKKYLQSHPSQGMKHLCEPCKTSPQPCREVSGRRPWSFTLLPKVPGRSWGRAMTSGDTNLFRDTEFTQRVWC